MPADGGQLELALGPFRNVRLFSEHFLAERLPAWPEFVELDASALLERLRGLWLRERDGLPRANEAQTEERWVKPVLDALGFAYTVQAGVPSATGRRQPDYALFSDDETRADADLLSGVARYSRALAVADAKRFDRPLDRRRVDGALSEDPVAQIVHYVSITRRPWGVLTNGRLWRLYAARGDLVEGACLEVDLVALLERGDPVAFRYFAAFFGIDAFSPDSEGRCFLDRALDESRASATRVGDQLEAQVFAAVPLIVEGLLGEDERTEAALASAFDHALVLLYRLLFCLHAEARGLLPLSNPHYARYSIREQRLRLAADRDSGRVFSIHSDDLYNDLRALFRIVDRGDPALGVNEYDGGLFSADAHPYLQGRSVPDGLLAPALDGLYRVSGELVDYRDLAVRHLGTIYERILDFRLVQEGGTLILQSATGRRDSGSYFTPQDVVDQIVVRTLDPLLTRTSRAIAEVGLRGEDALEGFLALRILDPAMGSGHFLVAAAAYVAQYIATDPSYEGDLALVDIQRLVSERCLYGVDLNPMAVELAQLSLWLTTVRSDEPLVFLPNLRTGNSLVGFEVTGLKDEDDDLLSRRLADEAETLIAGVTMIAARGSRSGTSVHASAREAGELAELRKPLTALADQAMRPAFAGTTRTFHWDIEFPEVFLDGQGRRLTGAGFDAIIGNPPYVRIQALGRSLADYCRRRFDTASGSFDTYVPFLERGLELLAPAGRLGFIVPSRFLKAEYGTRLRELFADQRLVEEIVDFGDAQLFAGATNYTCILLLDHAGVDDLEYRSVRGDPVEVRRAMVDLDAVHVERFMSADLGAGPWVLAADVEREVLDAAGAGARRLDEVTAGIFTGLQTSADEVYVLEDRGLRSGLRVAYSRASDRELELEPDLLHPLATGKDVEPYAFKRLRRLLLFPYAPNAAGGMRLIPADELARLPRIQAYLREHEPVLRAREGGRMDHEEWYAFGRNQSLGAHVLPKLGVAATVRRLEVAADLGGDVHFHNVRVNGILPLDGGPSLPALLALLNSRLLDFVFRRVSIPHAGGHFAANKQWIAPLPIQTGDPAALTRLDGLGRELHEVARNRFTEQGGFLDWLGGLVGASIHRLDGSGALLAYDGLGVDGVLDVLRANRRRLSRGPDSRALRETIDSEHAQSVARLGSLRTRLVRAERAADEEVYALYRIGTMVGVGVETR